MKLAWCFIWVLCYISFVVSDLSDATEEDLCPCNVSSRNIAASRNGGRCSTHIDNETKHCSYINNEDKATLKAWHVAPEKPININFTFNGSYNIGCILVKYENSTGCLKAGYITLMSETGKHISRSFSDPKRITHWQLNHLELVNFQSTKTLHLELGGFRTKGTSRIEEIKIFPGPILHDSKEANMTKEPIICLDGGRYDALIMVLNRTLTHNISNRQIMNNEVTDTLKAYPVIFAILILGTAQLIIQITLLFCNCRPGQDRMEQSQWYTTAKSSQRPPEHPHEIHTYNVVQDRTDKACGHETVTPGQHAGAVYESIPSGHGIRNQEYTAINMI